MAAPHITSACAYVKMLKPSASVDLVIRELARLSVDFGARGKDKKYGFGCPRLGTLFRTKVVSKEIVYSGTPRIISTANTKKTIMLVWAQVREAKQYIIYRKKAGGKYSIVKTLSKGSSIWYDRTAKSGVKYTYRIRARFSGKKYSGYGKYAVVVRLKKPGSFRAYAGSGCLTLSWSKAKGAKKYQVQISRRRDFGKVKKYKTTGEKKMIRIADLDQGTYYVRIRAYRYVNGKYYYSAWSDKKSAKTKRRTAKMNNPNNTKFALSHAPEHTKYVFGVRVNRVVALRDIRPGVKKGSIGGFVASEKCLSFHGRSWVADDACVLPGCAV